MKALLRFLWCLLRAVPVILLTPVLALFALISILLSDLFSRLRARPELAESRRPATRAASIVIPNWNGRDLLEKYLPSVVAAAAGNAENEIIVVDNGSSDGSADFLRERFPGVRLIALDRNLGFGKGSNMGFQAANNDIIVLLNSDMRVSPDFLGPLLDDFSDELVFAVSCQIFFSDPEKLREETGLTEGWWEEGGLRVRHRIDPAIDRAYPCFYGGGGSCAFDRRKFLELGGFDPLLEPFYFEDTDLGFMAWKRGWKVLYEPHSIVYHEHRGTIGKHFAEKQIQAVLKKNGLLFCWKNIHEPARIVSHFCYATAGVMLSAVFGDTQQRANFRGLCRAILQLFGALNSRARARRLAAISDTEAFRRPLGGYFRDRFQQLPARPDPLRVLFISPYPICPPVHGGGVFMYQTVTRLAPLCELHLIILLDYQQEWEANQQFAKKAASVELMVRFPAPRKPIFPLSPHSVHEFANADFSWLIHRQIYLKEIDVIQLEYTNMGQYGGGFRQIASILFEHDIYFQSIARFCKFTHGVMKLKAMYEYLRALRYELTILPRFDRVQVCSPANRDYLLSFLPKLAPRIDDNLRAGVDTSLYPMRMEGREPKTMLFLGGVRHLPNLEALQWFTRQVMPLILKSAPDTRLIVVGSEPPPAHALPDFGEVIEIRGFVEDVLEPLGRYAVFVCPILSGSGIRVKLLEAFAAGIPVVSTRIGAEGLADRDGETCLLADDAAEFARKVLDLFANPALCRELAMHARVEVEERWDIAKITKALAESYRREVPRKRGTGGR